MMTRAAVFLGSVAAMALGLSAGAQAQEMGAQSGYAGGDIIVTAQKRSERLQEVPLAVSAIGGSDIADRGLSSLAQIGQLAPNVNLNDGIVNPTALVPFIRGIGMVDNTPETDLPIAVSIDGIYMPNVYAGFIDAFDIQQVEILRGPQGTLQGRNAPGGAVNITTRRPGDSWVLRGMAEYRRFDDIRLNVGIDGPIVEDMVGIKLAAMRRKADGFQKNETTGEDFGGRDIWAFKAGLSLTPSENLDIWLSGDYTRDKSPPTSFRPANDGIDHPRPETDDQMNTIACMMFGACTPYPRYTTGQTFFGNNSTKIWGVSSTINWDIGGATLTSVTGYRDIRDVNYIDVDALPFPILEQRPTTMDSRTFSQEFRIASNDGGLLTFGDHIHWMFGAYHMDYKFFRGTDLYIFNVDNGLDYKQDLKSYALFGQLGVQPTEKLELTFGFRQNWDKKDFVNVTFGLGAEEEWKKFIFDVGVNYKFNYDHMAYARFARGFRPGGFNQNLTPYNEELVDSWEAGVKTQWLDRRLTVNLAGFYYTYDGIQRQTDVYDGLRFVRVTSNAGKSRAFGAELEVIARPVENLNMNFAVGYLDAKYKEWTDFEGVDANNNPIPVDNSGLPVYHAPKWTINAGVSYEIPVSNSFVGKIIPSADFYHKSSYFTQASAHPVSFENGYTLVNAALKLRDQSERFTLTFFADNIFDEYYINSGGTLGGLGLYIHEAPPRTYGARFEFEF